MTHFVTDRKLDWLCAKPCARLSKHGSEQKYRAEIRKEDTNAGLQHGMVEQRRLFCRAGDTSSSLHCLAGVLSVNVRQTKRLSADVIK